MAVGHQDWIDRTFMAALRGGSLAEGEPVAPIPIGELSHQSPSGDLDAPAQDAHAARVVEMGHLDDHAVLDLQMVEHLEGPVRPLSRKRTSAVQRTTTWSPSITT